MKVWLIMDADVTGHHADDLLGVFASEDEALAVNDTLYWGGGYIVEHQVGTLTERARNLWLPQTTQSTP